MTPPETEPCGHTIYGMGPCVRPKGHLSSSLHQHEDGTEFSNSGKVGLGEVGPAFRIPVEHSAAAPSDDRSLDALVERLSLTYTPSGVGVWLVGMHRVAGEQPLGMWIRGDRDRVRELADMIEGEDCNMCGGKGGWQGGGPSAEGYYEQVCCPQCEGSGKVPLPPVVQSPQPALPDGHPALRMLEAADKAAADRLERIEALEAERDALRDAAMAVAVDERPTHDHYENPDDCPMCRLFLALGIETRAEQQAGREDANRGE
jgi:hypothetical protein